VAPVAHALVREFTVRPTFCWWVIGTTVVAFSAVGIAASVIVPPVVTTADENFTLAAILAAAGVVVFASTSCRPFNRQAQLATFMSLVLIGSSWYAARQWVFNRQIEYQASRQREQLRTATVQLSGNIVNFLRDRRRFLPPPPSAATWDADERAITRFENQTVRLFETRFAREVRSAHDLLAMRGLRDRDLDNVYRHPTDEFQIRTIAIKVALLANRIQR
jgi:hypothetical protein